MRGAIQVMGIVWGLGSAAVWAAEPSVLMSGTIAAVDAQQQTLTLNTGPSAPQQELQVDTRAAILDGQRQMTLQDLAPGTDVTVEYAQQNGQRVAHRVVVKRANALSGRVAKPLPGLPPEKPRGGFNLRGIEANRSPGDPLQR